MERQSARGRRCKVAIDINYQISILGNEHVDVAIGAAAAYNGSVICCSKRKRYSDGRRT